MTTQNHNDEAYSMLLEATRLIRSGDSALAELGFTYLRAFANSVSQEAVAHAIAHPRPREDDNEVQLALPIG